jgi:hypothetical protein
MACWFCSRTEMELVRCTRGLKLPVIHAWSERICYYFRIIDSANLSIFDFCYCDIYVTISTYLIQPIYLIFVFCYCDSWSLNWYLGISPVKIICNNQLLICRILAKNTDNNCQERALDLYIIPWWVPLRLSSPCALNLFIWSCNRFLTYSNGFAAPLDEDFVSVSPLLPFKLGGHVSCLPLLAAPSP